MINIYEVNETNNTTEHEKLDVRTITMASAFLIVQTAIWML